MHATRGRTSAQGNQGILANIGQTAPGANLNMQQPFYQTMAFRPNIPLTGSGMPHGPVPDVFFPRTPAPIMPMVGNDMIRGMTDGVWEQIAKTLR
jgi:hypothetical protein